MSVPVDSQSPLAHSNALSQRRMAAVLCAVEAEGSASSARQRGVEAHERQQAELERLRQRRKESTLRKQMESEAAQMQTLAAVVGGGVASSTEAALGPVGRRRERHGARLRSSSPRSQQLALEDQLEEGRMRRARLSYSIRRRYVLRRAVEAWKEGKNLLKRRRYNSNCPGAFGSA
jgi:hypothetical protein